ncbi:MAG: hypothetical protein IPL49_18205 [Saprospirales bacterium]|nr:hypothetical protein [Saprospirales bacterium]
MSLSIAAIATGLGYVTSRQIAYHPKKERWLLLAYFPYAMAPVILAACLQHYFLVLGWSGKWSGGVVGPVVHYLPFCGDLFLRFWNQRTQSMEHLVTTLGGTYWQAFRKVLLPMSRSALLVCFFKPF